MTFWHNIAGAVAIGLLYLISRNLERALALLREIRDAAPRK